MLTKAVSGPGTSRMVRAGALVIGMFCLSVPCALAGTTTYVYDSQGRIRQVSFSDGSSAGYQFDSAGNRLQINKNTVAAPTAGNVSLTTTINTPGTTTLTPAGSWTSLAVVTQSPNGNATISGTTATFTPNTGYSGSTSFTYKAIGPGGSSAPATVSVTVSTVAAPTAGNVSLTTAMNTPGTVTLTPGGNWTSLAIATQSPNGNATISGTTATFTPTTSYSGSTSFTYQATGPGGTSAPGTVSVTVTASANHAPVCSNWTINIPAPTTAPPVSSSVDGASLVTHCTDADSDTMTVASPTTLPIAFTISSGQTLNYPFSVSDGHGGTGSAVLTITRP